MSIAPDANLKPDDRVSLPVGLVNEIHSLLLQLPAGQSMHLIISMREEANIVRDADAASS